MTSFVITDPAAIGVAADELQGIGSTLAATNTAAAAPTTGVLPPATDSVSVRAAALLDAHAAQYQALSAQAELFHDEFVQTLVTAQNAYTEAEASNAAGLQPATTNEIALIMGGTGNPSPTQAYMMSVEQAYLAKNYAGYTLVSLKTPEQFWPITGTTSESFGSSVRQGLAILNNAILTQTAAGHRVVVVGYSQSATIATLEMRYLDALPAALRPNSNLLNFVLMADPNSSMGGILTHWIPGFGAFHVITPLNTPYLTAIYTIQYDGIANFPRNILWLPADLNALFGIFDLHGSYPFLSAAKVAAAIPHQIGNVTFYFMPTANLPLLDPLRMIPILGNPVANALQPALRTIVDLGYSSSLPVLFPGLGQLSVAGSLGQSAGYGIAGSLVAGLPPVGTPILANTF